MMFCDSIAIFPAPSMAVQMIVVIPIGNSSDALFDKERIPLSSLAIAFPTFTGVRAPVASIITSLGTDMSGFVKSFGTGFTSGNSICSSIIYSGSDSCSCCSTVGSLTISCPIINFSRTMGVENF